VQTLNRPQPPVAECLWRSVVNPITPFSGLILVVGTKNTLSEKEITLAKVLKGAGYDTAMFGKWHLGTEAQSQPQNQGFDEFYGILNSSDDSLHVPMMKRFHFPLPPEESQPHIVQAQAGGKLEAVKPYTTDARAHIDIELADHAIDYVRKHANGRSLSFYICRGLARTIPTSLPPNSRGNLASAHTATA
jgi:arylsulfatase A-like enzyme